MPDMPRMCADKAPRPFAWSVHCLPYAAAFAFILAIVALT